MTEDQMLEELLRKAGGGDVEAQYELGWRSAIGMGVPQDDTVAIRWLRAAAEAGHALAQNNLGARYLTGEGVPQDAVAAYKWFTLAALAGDRKAGKNRDTVAGQLTPEQLAQAEAAVARLQEKRG
jgi:uncharacterized protein